MTLYYDRIVANNEVDLAIKIIVLQMLNTSLPRTLQKIELIVNLDDSSGSFTRFRPLTRFSFLCRLCPFSTGTPGS